MSWSTSSAYLWHSGVCVLGRRSGTGSFSQIFIPVAPVLAQSQTLHPVHGPVLAGVPDKKPKGVLIAGV